MLFLWICFAALLLIWEIVSFQLKNGRIIVFFHPIIYELCVWYLFVINWIINISCVFQPQTNKWDHIEPSNHHSVKFVWERLLKGDTKFSDDELMKTFLFLPKATVKDHLIGKVTKQTNKQTNKTNKKTKANNQQIFIYFCRLLMDEFFAQLGVFSI
jgi:hypothetical protein